MTEIERLANENVCILLIGNKCDKETERKVTLDQGAEIAKHYSIPFFETSAKNASNVEQAFSTITHNIHAKLQKQPATQNTKNGVLKKGASIEEPKKGGCC